MRLVTLTMVSWQREFEKHHANAHLVEGHCLREPVAVNLEKLDYMYRVRRLVTYDNFGDKSIEFATECTVIRLCEGRFQIEVEETPDQIRELMA